MSNISKVNAHTVQEQNNLSLGNDPSLYRQQDALMRLHACRAALLADDPTLAEDQQLMHDMLDGEAGDAMDVLRDTVHMMMRAEAMADSAAQMAKQIAARAQRFERRADLMRAGILGALNALGLPRLELPIGTLSVRKGSQRLVLAEGFQVPAEYERHTVEPDKAAIKAAILAGAEIAGASVEAGPATLSVRKG